MSGDQDLDGDHRVQAIILWKSIDQIAGYDPLASQLDGYMHVIRAWNYGILGVLFSRTDYGQS